MSLPAGWKSAHLGDVCRVVSGGTPKTGVLDYWDGDVPWITPKDLSRDRSQVVQGGSRWITQAGLAASSATLFPAGSVIVSSRAPIGYVAIAGRQMAANQGCKIAIPSSEIDSRYLYWFLIAAKGDLEARASGTTFKEISGKEFARTVLRWPPLEAQRCIVDALEAHLSGVDAGSIALGAAGRRLVALRRAGLQALAVGPAVSLGELATESGYGTSTKCTRDGGGVPVVRIPNLVNGRIDMSDEKRASDPLLDLRSLMLQPGDLLVVRTNGSRELIGRPAVVQAGVAAAFASYLIRFRVDQSRVRPEWVRLMLETPRVRGELEGLAASSAGQYNLGLAKLNGVSIPCPGLMVQDALLADYRVAMSSWEALTAELRSTARRAKILTQALMHRAFSGGLTRATPQVSAGSLDVALLCGRA